MKRLLIHLLLLSPLAWMLVELFVIEVNDPIKYIYSLTGITATVILFLSIVISLVKKKINLIKYRKDIGLFGFLYAFIHLINFVVFDAQFDIVFIIEETIDKPFVYLGMLAFFIVFFMAITSTKNLYRKYNKFHKLIYLALILITIHFVMAQKTINLDMLCYIVIILIIGYYKLLQQIVKNNKV